MMGYTMMGGGLAWLAGAVAMVAIWGGLWWLLAAVGVRRTPPPTEQHRVVTAGRGEWEQPSFAEPQPTTPPVPERTDLR